MSLTINDIRDAAFLSTAAYDHQQPAWTYLSGSRWQWVNPAAFGISSLFVDSNGYFSVNIPYLLDAQALLAYDSSTQTLAISFRGTEVSEINDWIDDAIGGLIDFGVIYQGLGLPLVPSFADLVSNVLDQATTFGATRILITGHSLGGAMAEEAMAEHLGDTRVCTRLI